MEKPTTEVVAAVIARANTVLITRRFDHAHLGGLWEFPGGKVESGEDHKAALTREVHEECGIHITVKERLWIGIYEDSERTIRVHFYQAATSPDAIVQNFEVAEHRWCAANKLDDFDFPETNIPLVRAITRHGTAGMPDAIR